MSSLRGRTRDSSWQWLIIGVVLGLGCSGVACLGAYAAGLLVFNLPGQAPTTEAAVQIVTATPLPVTPTVPTLPPTSPAAASTQKPGVTAGTPAATPYIVVPTKPGATTAATPIEIGSLPPPTDLPTLAATDSPIGLTDLPTTSPQADLLTNATPMINLSAATGIWIGTDGSEIKRAVDDCTTRDKGTGCNEADSQDSLPRHQVTLNVYQMDKYEVTYSQYVAFLNTLGPNKHLTGCGGNPCVIINGPKNVTKGSDPGSYVSFDKDNKIYTVTTKFYSDHPVAFVTWYGAASYCKAVGRRLPTEAEWEHAVRTPDDAQKDNNHIYPWGSVWDETKAKTSRPQKDLGSVPVTQYKGDVTHDGIYDMAGNVSEWVFDWYDPNYYKTAAASGISPQGPASGAKNTKVFRGGNWDSIPMFARAMQRRDMDPTNGTGAVGFRCAADGNGDQSASPTTTSGGGPTPASTLASGIK